MHDMIGYNGTVSGYFKGKKGVRQGDPLSPYIFVIAMNWISFMLNNATAHGNIQYHSKCRKMKLTHLSYADDLLIFIDGSLESVQNVLQVLHEFEQQPGFAVSYQKKSFYASGLSPQEIETIHACIYWNVLWDSTCPLSWSTAQFKKTEPCQLWASHSPDQVKTLLLVSEVTLLLRQAPPH